jgi:hypothetical protein
VGPAAHEGAAQLNGSAHDCSRGPGIQARQLGNGGENEKGYSCPPRLQWVEVEADRRQRGGGSTPASALPTVNSPLISEPPFVPLLDILKEAHEDGCGAGEIQRLDGGSASVHNCRQLPRLYGASRAEWTCLSGGCPGMYLACSGKKVLTTG